MKKSILIIGIILVLGLVVVLEVTDKITPIVRNNITKPIYTIGDKHYETALKQNKKVVKFGSMFLGLYPGGMAFSSVKEAMLYMQKNNWDKNKWNIYLLSGDYDRDVTQGYINKSLLVLEKINTL